MPSRGWIVPVGGCRSSLCRSGVEPPTGTIHPRQISLRNSKSEKTSPAMNLLIDSYFLSSVQCPRVDGSFRSGVAGRPCAGRGLNPRPESETHAKIAPDGGSPSGANRPTHSNRLVRVNSAETPDRNTPSPSAAKAECCPEPTPTTPRESPTKANRQNRCRH